jgi:hypothetical protein
MKAVSAVMGVIGLFALVLHPLSDFRVMGLNGPIGHCGMERTIMYPAFIWLIAYDSYLMFTLGPLAKEGIIGSN